MTKEIGWIALNRIKRHENIMSSICSALKSMGMTEKNNHWEYIFPNTEKIFKLKITKYGVLFYHDGMMHHLDYNKEPADIAQDLVSVIEKQAVKYIDNIL